MLFVDMLGSDSFKINDRDGSPLLKIKNTAKLFLIFFFCCFRVRNVSRVLLKSKRSCKQFYYDFTMLLFLAVLILMLSTLHG